jgi:transcriptional regulator with XRE-family HTH domain
MSVKERLILFITYKGLSARSFCRKIGVSGSYINSMRKSIQPDKLESIAANFPDLNTAWLMTGQGEMLNEKDKNIIDKRENPPPKNHEKDLLIKSQQETIDALKKYIEVLERELSEKLDVNIEKKRNAI